MLAPVLRNMDPAYEEASMTAGASRFMTLLRVDLSAHLSGVLRRPHLVLHHLHRSLRDTGGYRNAGRYPGVQHQDLLGYPSPHGRAARVRHRQRAGHERAGAKRRPRPIFIYGCLGQGTSIPPSPAADTVPRSSTWGGPDISGPFSLSSTCVWLSPFRLWCWGGAACSHFISRPPGTCCRNSRSSTTTTP